MFCPRCGRPVGEAANFCGGCGLPKAEILKYNSQIQEQMSTPEIQPAAEIMPVDLNDVNNTISQLENDLNSTLSATDYTTETTNDTTDVVTPSDYIRNEISQEQQQPEIPYTGRYSYTPQPEYPQYSYTQQDSSYTSPVTPSDEVTEEPVSTVDFIWMMLISSLPAVGLFYLVWLAFVQKGSKTKASFARAVMIITLFSFLLVFVFMAGLFATQIAMFY